MIDSIRLSGVSKGFRLPAIPKEATVKDLLIRTMRPQPAEHKVHALTDVSFSVEPGSMLGIIGRNGSGKTTLLRVIAGILKADSGTVTVHGSLAPVMALGAGFHPDLTGRESARIELLSMGFSRSHTEGLLPSIAQFSGIDYFFDAAVRSYSIGMIMRVAFACAICVDPDVLLLDEVLAVGDEAFAMKCFDAIANFRKRGKTIVLVTHSADIVEQMCDTALWLDAGTIAGLGDPRAVVAAYHALSGQEAS
jgi:ABC-type polysaccharide/polyol phosphate transport system ATPase subunit